MRFSLLAVGAYATSALAAPVEKRQAVSNVLQVTQALVKQVTQYTAVINSTLDSVQLNGVSAAGVKVASVEGTVKTQVANIVTTINSVLDTTSGLSVINDVNSLVSSITGSAPIVGSLPIVGGILKERRDSQGLNLDLVTGLTKGLPVNSLGLSSVTNSLPVVGRRQLADTSSVISLATSLVSEVTSTVANVAQVVPDVQLSDSIASLSGALTNLVTDLDNVVGGVTTAVTDILKNVPVSASVFNISVTA